MLFYTWMIKNHLKGNSAKGLLARSMKAEGNGFPKRRRLKRWSGILNIAAQAKKLWMPLWSVGRNTKTMREKVIEQKLVKAVRAKGGIAPKFVSPGFSGVPDRLILLPDGKCGFVEVKAPGGKPRPLQESRIRLLRRLGFLVFILDDESEIPHILSEIGGDSGGV